MDALLASESSLFSHFVAVFGLPTPCGVLKAAVSKRNLCSSFFSSLVYIVLRYRNVVTKVLGNLMFYSFSGKVTCFNIAIGPSSFSFARSSCVLTNREPKKPTEFTEMSIKSN